MIKDDDYFRLFQSTISKIQSLTKSNISEIVGATVSAFEIAHPVRCNNSPGFYLFQELSIETNTNGLIELLSKYLMTLPSRGRCNEFVFLFIRWPGLVNSTLLGENSGLLLHLFAGPDSESFSKVFECIFAYRIIFSGCDFFSDRCPLNIVHREVILAIFLVALSSGAPLLLLSMRLRALLSSHIEEFSSQEILEPFLLLLASYVDLFPEEQVTFVANLLKAFEIYTGKEGFFLSVIEDSLPGVILYISGAETLVKSCHDVTSSWNDADLQMVYVVCKLLGDRMSTSQEEVFYIFVVLIVCVLVIEIFEI